MVRPWVFTALFMGAVGAGPALAQDVEPTESAELRDAEIEFSAEAEATLTGDEARTDARSRVIRPQIEERIPRSTPAALRYEPGVSVQQTAHGQASPYVRGMTGQQVVHLFDGVRLNNGIYRQGPNQYFFTVDANTLQGLEVARGSSSTRFGSDALGGAILATPVAAPLLGTDEQWGWIPGGTLRYRSADQEYGGRLQLGVQAPSVGSFLFGGGYREVSRLRAGGVVRNPIGGEPAIVPRFEESVDHPTDPSRWRTQLGTGFREATFDGRYERTLSSGLRATTAVYGFRQYDAPRTDQCPPPEAPRSECLWVDEQFRTLALAALRGDVGEVRDFDLTLSYQRHHERRRRDRPRSLVRFDWLDVVQTFGAAVRAGTDVMELSEATRLRIGYGAEAYQDRVESEASQTLVDIGRSFDFTRGQYLDHSRYISLGAFAEARLDWRTWTLHLGGRTALVGIDVPADPESGTQGVRRRIPVLVGNARISYQPIESTTLSLAYDQGFRSPNLDDLSSRQQTGPGFQFENPDLRPERAHSIELGLVSEHGKGGFSLWGFSTILRDAITRDLRTDDDCPPLTPQCAASRTQFQLVNAEGDSLILGVEFEGRLRFDWGLSLRGTMGWTWGEGPNLESNTGARRVPLSRIPPLGGSLEAIYRDWEHGFYGGASLRWALRQDRLAPSDTSDARIPIGGTPGYAVVDLRAGWRSERSWFINMVVENVGDAAYRIHGSSVNGPGFGISATLGYQR